jgi:hypothetical protein
VKEGEGRRKNKGEPRRGEGGEGRKQGREERGGERKSNPTHHPLQLAGKFLCHVSSLLLRCLDAQESDILTLESLGLNRKLSHRLSLGKGLRGPGLVKEVEKRYKDGGEEKEEKEEEREKEEKEEKGDVVAEVAGLSRRMSEASSGGGTPREMTGGGTPRGGGTSPPPERNDKSKKREKHKDKVKELRDTDDEGGDKRYTRAPSNRSFKKGAYEATKGVGKGALEVTKGVGKGALSGKKRPDEKEKLAPK